MRLIKGLLAVLAGTGLLAACDPQGIEKLEEGVSTESDVRAAFGEPEAVWDEPGGARTFEYNRNPQGHRNYMVTIGPDGKMSALRQVLTPENFARIQPGMPMEQVRRMLGRPAKRTPYAASREEAWDWRYLGAPGGEMFFTVWFDQDMKVKRTGSSVEIPPG